MPDHPWLLTTLCTLKPDHKIFDKDYTNKPEYDPLTPQKWTALQANGKLNHRYF